jgi:hypothetical protein
MKTNVLLQNKIGFQNPAQKVWYAAHVLKAALTNSPAVLVRNAVPAVAAKPAVLAQTAKPARAATAAVLAAANTTGYAFGELYLNSPAYPAGTAIPAIPAKPASAAVVGVPAVVAIPATTALMSPAVVALKGWEDAIVISKSATELTVVAELPVIQGTGIVGSVGSFIAEITPSTLQASDWLDEIVYALGQADNSDRTIPTLEQYLYKYALDCNHEVVDTIRNVNGIQVPCKQITATLYPTGSFDINSLQTQLPHVSDVANVAS